MSTMDTVLEQPVGDAPHESALSGLILRKYESLAEFLTTFAPGGAKRLLPASVRVASYFRNSGFSGYEYSFGDELYGKVGFSPLLYGGFVVHRLLTRRSVREESYDIYSEEGKLLFSELKPAREVLFVDLIEMDPLCPILSHLYNYLSHEYRQAGKGAARSRQMFLIERFLKTLAAAPGAELSVKAGSLDPAITALSRKILAEERDPVLSWSERQLVFKGIREEREKVIATKERVHALSWARYRLPIALRDIRDFFHRTALRPSSNLRGLSYRYTIGVLIWFFKTVRGNIGYSIALAIYGPFTFYFITQPLNPHAMWAVGKVRSGYLDVVQKATSLAGLGAPVATAVANSVANVTSASPAAGSTATTQAQPQAPAPVSEKAPVATDLSKYKASHLGILLSTDVPPVDEQSWSDRMSNFKDMQIGFEEHLQFAARMGRLEQLETQINFPLIAEGAWLELDRYIDEVSAARARAASSGHNSPEVAGFLENEETRARRLQLYVWDRLYRYIQDHPYIVMDLNGEQTYKDYYLGRSFVLWKDMTLKLAKTYDELKKPAGFKKVEKLAAVLQKNHKDGDTVTERLVKNTGLFGQKERLDGRELRAYMKRQWEVLYLLQNKAQEASNFGLQAYTWSVRNTLYILQNFYGAKRRELALLFGPATGAPGAASAGKEIRETIEPLYETLFYAMNLEYASLKPELAERLANDIEFGQRETVIQTMESFLQEREKFVKGLIK